MADDQRATKDIRAWFGQQLEETASELVGGLARFKVLVLLACVLGLDSADKATVGAIAVPLQQALDIGNMGIGLLVTASTGVGALATLPMGILVDRMNRIHLLTASIIIWSVTMAVSGFANSFVMLLMTRLALGAVIAAALPVVSSLTGDYFRPGVRGKIWGYILSGELFGAGVGVLISGEVASLLSWRFSFWVLSLISLGLAAVVWKVLPEPARGGQSPLRYGKEELSSTQELKDREDSNGDQNNEEGPKEKENDIVEETVAGKNVSPRTSKILENNPSEMPFWPAIRYILSIRTNILLIVASGCGYYFFTGLRTFAVVYLRGRFHLSSGIGRLLFVVLGLGSIIGVLITGQLADRRIAQGHINARITVASITFVITAALFLLAFSISSLYLAAPLFFLAAACLGGTNAPIDAARLDIMHSRLWGRAESVRTALRYSFEAVAPIVFGWVSSLFGSQGGTFEKSSQSSHIAGNALPLAHTFMIMVMAVIIAGIVLYFARKTYPRDVATALASEEAAENG